MPRSKRPPIDYQPQFGAGIFRPKADVEHELAELEHGAAAETAGPVAPSREDAPAPNEATNERTNERTRTRHSFDIWRDQLLALTEIQVERFNRTGRKPKLGELVQEALDGYIAQQQKRPNVRTNERTYEQRQR